MIETIIYILCFSFILYILYVVEIELKLYKTSRVNNEKRFFSNRINPNPKIICIGGSTTFGAAIPIQESYPVILQKKLFNVEVINAGVCGWKIKDFCEHMPELRIGDKDIVLLNCSFNDGVAYVRNYFMHYIWAFYPMMSYKKKISHILKIRSQPFGWIVDRIFFRFLISFYRTNILSQDVISSVSDLFTINFLSLVKALDNKQVIYINFPSYPKLNGYRKLSPKNHLWSRGFNRFCLDAFKIGEPIEDNIAESISKESNMLYLDLTERFSKLNADELYIDEVHFSGKGNDIVAQGIKDFMVEKGVIKPR